MTGSALAATDMLLHILVSREFRRSVEEGDRKLMVRTCSPDIHAGLSLVMSCRNPDISLPDNLTKDCRKTANKIRMLTGCLHTTLSLEHMRHVNLYEHPDYWRHPQYVVSVCRGRRRRMNDSQTHETRPFTRSAPLALTSHGAVFPGTGDAASLEAAEDKDQERRWGP